MNKKHKIIEDILDDYLKKLKKGKDPAVESYLKTYPYSQKELEEILSIACSAYWRDLSGANLTPSSSFFLSLREKLLNMLRDKGTLK